MATFYLLNTTWVGTTKYQSGRLVDDTIDPKAAIVAAGGVVIPSSDTVVAAAAAFVQARRGARAVSDEWADFFMSAAADSSSQATISAAALVALLASTSPAGVAAAAVTGTGTTVARADHAHADPNRAAAGTALTDTATQTIATPGTGWRTLPTLSQGGTLTVGTTGAVAGDQLDVVRTSVSAFTYAIVNGGGGGGTLCTFPVSKQASAKLQFDGTNWALRGVGTN